jgi:isopenicillin N synthase-like dioxygenase
MAATVCFPVVNMEKLETEEKATAMEVIRDACENWGFFEVCILHTRTPLTPPASTEQLTNAPHLAH